MKLRVTYRFAFYLFILKIFIAVFLLFLSSAGFQDRYIQGWYQQWITGLNGTTIKDMTFLDSLTGFAVTSSNSLLQEYIIKTTNGGDNWLINYTHNTPNSNYYFIKVKFIDLNTGYVFGWKDILKTTNRGLNWSIINTELYPDDIALVNEDTMLAVKSNSYNGGVYRSTNGGYNWQRIWTAGTSNNPCKIYMYNINLGFSCVDFWSPHLRKTTNGGLDWFDLVDNEFYDIKFIDTLIGWKITGTGIKKTTNGGYGEWITQILPGSFSYNGGLCLSALNKDTIWFVGPTVTRNGFPYGVLCKTTNGGLNWGYQIPDTSIRISNLTCVVFINGNNGWAFQDSIGVHTKVGGNDTTYYTAVDDNATTIPDDFVLYQNYPNPFNQTTIINYQLTTIQNVNLIVYDITGKQISTLTDERKPAGRYSVLFDAGGLSSGIYFYTIILGGNGNNPETRLTRKMLLIK